MSAGKRSGQICHRIAEIEKVAEAIADLPSDDVERALANVARFKSSLFPPNKFSESALA